MAISLNTVNSEVVRAHQRIDKIGSPSSNNKIAWFDIGDIRVAYAIESLIIPPSPRTLKVILPFSYDNNQYMIICTHDYARSDSYICTIQKDSVYPVTVNSFNITSNLSMDDVTTVKFITVGYHRNDI